LHTIFPAALTLISQLSIFMPAFSIYLRTNSTSSLVAGLGFAILLKPFRIIFYIQYAGFLSMGSNFADFLLYIF